jgi:protein-disulfide isomerase
MNRRIRFLLLSIFSAAALAAPKSLSAQMQRSDVERIVHDYLAAHPEEVSGAVQKYLADHPEAIRAAIVALAARRGQERAEGVERRQEIADNAAALFDAPLQTRFGAAGGVVTLVEFFDFNCGFCRRGLADVLALLRDDPGLRVIVKDFPVLGADSVEAAKVAIALQKQNPDAAMALEFHRRLLETRGRVDRARALAVAGDLGFDAARLETDAASAEVNDVLLRNQHVAQALGVHATPSYLIGDRVFAGAVGESVLKARLAQARKN